MFEALSNVVGRRYLTREDCDRVAYSRDFSLFPPGLPDAIVRPGTTEEIASVVKIAKKHNMPIVPRGGGTAQEGGAVPVNGGIMIELTRMNNILKIDEENGVIHLEAGVFFGKIDQELHRKGWRIGILPSGALGGTIGGHLSKAGIGWGNIAYGTQGDQVLGITAVLPSGEIITTGSGASSHLGQFSRYTVGPDLTGLFVGTEGAFGIITDLALRMYPLPENQYIERFNLPTLQDAIPVFRSICINQLAVYISAFQLTPEVVFDILVEGLNVEVEKKMEKINNLISSRNGRSLGTTEAKQMWDNRFYETGKAYSEGMGAPVVFHTPFNEIQNTANEMYKIFKEHEIKNYKLKIFPLPNCVELAAISYYDQLDEREIQKINRVTPILMRRAMELGSVPYAKGKLWGDTLCTVLKDSTYWAVLKHLKTFFDPDNIMNPGALGIQLRR